MRFPTCGITGIGSIYDYYCFIIKQVFEGHTHYVMQIVINPKDNNQFASASLDRTIKVGTFLMLCAFYMFVLSYTNVRLWEWLTFCGYLLCPFFPYKVWQLGSASPNFTLEGHDKVCFANQDTSWRFHYDFLLNIHGICRQSEVPCSEECRYKIFSYLAQNMLLFRVIDTSMKI